MNCYEAQPYFEPWITDKKLPWVENLFYHHAYQYHPNWRFWKVLTSHSMGSTPSKSSYCSIYRGWVLFNCKQRHKWGTSVIY